MKKVIKCTTSRSSKSERRLLLDELAWIYNKMKEDGLQEEADRILAMGTGSTVGSRAATMSDDEIDEATMDMKITYSMYYPDSAQAMIRGIRANTVDVSEDYAEGFIDACKMLIDEFHIPIELE